MEYIYIIRTIDISAKTEEMLQKEFKTTQINYPLWENNTYDNYVAYLKSWKEDKFSKSYEDNAYCETYKTACDKVINNSCDMNDGGIYDYVSIIKMPMNRCYAETCTNESSVTLFKFDKEKEEYFEVDEDYNEKTKWLCGK